MNLSPQSETVASIWDHDEFRSNPSSPCSWQVGDVVYMPLQYGRALLHDGGSALQLAKPKKIGQASATSGEPLLPQLCSSSASGGDRDCSPSWPASTYADLCAVDINRGGGRVWVRAASKPPAWPRPALESLFKSSPALVRKQFNWQAAADIGQEHVLKQLTAELGLRKNDHWLVLQFFPDSDQIVGRLLTVLSDEVMCRGMGRSTAAPGSKLGTTNSTQGRANASGSIRMGGSGTAAGLCSTPGLPMCLRRCKVVKDLDKKIATRVGGVFSQLTGKLNLTKYVHRGAQRAFALGGGCFVFSKKSHELLYDVVWQKTFLDYDCFTATSNAKPNTTRKGQNLNGSGSSNQLGAPLGAPVELAEAGEGAPREEARPAAAAVRGLAHAGAPTLTRGQTLHGGTRISTDEAAGGGRTVSSSSRSEEALHGAGGTTLQGPGATRTTGGRPLIPLGAVVPSGGSGGASAAPSTSSSSTGSAAAVVPRMAVQGGGQVPSSSFIVGIGVGVGRSPSPLLAAAPASIAAAAPAFHSLDAPSGAGGGSPPLMSQAVGSVGMPLRPPSSSQLAAAPPTASTQSGATQLDLELALLNLQNGNGPGGPLYLGAQQHHSCWQYKPEKLLHLLKKFFKKHESKLLQRTKQNNQRRLPKNSEPDQQRIAEDNIRTGEPKDARAANAGGGSGPATLRAAIDHGNDDPDEPASSCVFGATSNKCQGAMLSFVTKKFKYAERTAMNVNVFFRQNFSFLKATRTDEVAAPYKPQDLRDRVSDEAVASFQLSQCQVFQSTPSVPDGSDEDHFRTATRGAVSSSSSTTDDITRQKQKALEQAQFLYSTVSVNRNMRTQLHRDKNNCGPSAVFSLGEKYTGGSTWVYDFELDELDGNADGVGGAAVEGVLASGAVGEACGSSSAASQASSPRVLFVRKTGERVHIYRGSRSTAQEFENGAVVEVELERAEQREVQLFRARKCGLKHEKAARRNFALGRVYNCKNEFVLFDGRIPHLTMAFSGERFTLVYYFHKSVRGLGVRKNGSEAKQSKLLEELDELKFQVPPIDMWERSGNLPIALRENSQGVLELPDSESEGEGRDEVGGDSVTSTRKRRRLDLDRAVGVEDDMGAARSSAARGGEERAKPVEGENDADMEDVEELRAWQDERERRGAPDEDSCDLQLLPSSSDEG